MPNLISRLALSALALAVSRASFAYDSESTGADGAFEPTASTTVTVPTSGRLDFTSIHIPTGVTVRFDGAGPVTLLASGDVLIEGVLDLRGGASQAGVGGLVALGGAPGPGGSWGGSALATGGLRGQGPAGGDGVAFCGAGGGAGPAASGQNGPEACGTLGGVARSSGPLPFTHGGSGGGGTESDGGGGGGGVIVIASSGTLTVTASGSILADGGPGSGRAGAGGGGSIRLVATHLGGAGLLSARSGGHCGGATQGGCGGDGAIRLEADVVAQDLYRGSAPRASVGRPAKAGLAEPPRLRIATIDGQAPATLAPGTNPQARTALDAPGDQPLVVVVEGENLRPGTNVEVVLSVGGSPHALRATATGMLTGTKAHTSATIELALPAGLPSTSALATLEAHIPLALAD